MPKGEHLRRLSDAQRAELVRRYTTPNADGSWDGCKILAEMFGISPPAILYNLRRLGVPIRDRKTSHGNGKRCKPITRLPTTPAPLCKCGCGQPTQWQPNMTRWQTYCPGHYRPRQAYHGAAWLRREYVERGRSLREIAAEFGVGMSSVVKALRVAGIPRRTTGESLLLRGSTRGAKNAAWKGGIAKWPYAPEWKRIARTIRRRDSYTCQLCHTLFPKSSKLLHVHHIDADKFNNDPANLVTVCASCHPKGARRERAAAAILAS